MRIGPLVALLACLFLSCQRKETREAGLRSGSIAPEFRLETLGHGRFYLNQQRGQVVVLLFWITTCQVCKREMLELADFQADLASERLGVVTVCSDPENLDAVHRIIDGLGIRFPVLLDHGGEVGKRYNVEDFPTTVVVDGGGKVALWSQGWAPELRTHLQTRIEVLLEEGGDRR